jgi:hypothetical protein
VGKRVNLPLFGEPETKADDDAKPVKKPSIDAARTRLGGRLTGDEGSVAGLTPGVIVTFAAGGARGSARRMPGVVLFVSTSEIHVLMDSVRLRRLRPAEIELHSGSVDVELGRIAADARLFGMLGEGQGIRYADEAGDLVDGKVVEKCRWGALVARDDGSILAVGFRKLWPSTVSGDA